MASVVSSWHPVSRFPLFMMGIDAGILCLRHTNSDPLPWASTSLRLFPTFHPARPLSSTPADEKHVWRKRADNHATDLIVLTALVTIVHHYLPQHLVMGSLSPTIWLTGEKHVLHDMDARKCISEGSCLLVTHSCFVPWFKP